jgi:uncharacterized protein YjbI with pentapeptide repeats
MLSKTELINRLYSPERKYVVQAIEELRVHGWLTDGSLRGAGLCRVQLQGIDLTGADLRNVDFHQAELESANLSLARLQGAKFTRANLVWADFSQADLTNAEFYKADLRRAVNLTEDQLRHVKRLWGAILPDGGSYDGRFNLPADLAQARWAKVDVDDARAMADFYGVSLEAYQLGQAQALESAVPQA